MAVLAVSCRKFVSVPPPVNTVTQDLVFSDSVNATLALTGVYASQTVSGPAIGNGNFIPGYFGLAGSVSADEFALSSSFLVSRVYKFIKTIFLLLMLIFLQCGI